MTTKTKNDDTFDVIRELAKYNPYLEVFYLEDGTVDLEVHGHAVITSELLKGMAQRGFALEKIFNYVDFDPVPNILKEDVVPSCVKTTYRFRDIEFSPLPQDNN